MQLTFLGATGTVTGSRYLVDAGRHRILVDCGMFQGLKQLRLRNWAPLPVPAPSIDAVVLTHAHIDHSGWLPRLCAEGFTGRIHATHATTALCGLLLPDSGHLQEEEARFALRHGYSRHSPPTPLYTEDDARRCLRQLEGHGFGEVFEPAQGFKAHFNAAGHILGAASVHLSSGAGSILFSGDLGRQDDLLMQPPNPPEAADIVLIESTYGDRERGNIDVLGPLADAISRTAARGGIVLVPSFAVGRAQTLLFAIRLLKDARRIPDLPVFVNSPMATNVTELFLRHPELHRLDRATCEAIVERVQFVNTEAQSRLLNDLRFPAVIISASGMATGGRVIHHIEALAPDPRNTLLFVGYQAAGTRGAALVGGAKQVKMHGHWVPIRAEVVSIEGMSAHADRSELLNWITQLPKAPDHVFVTHGEPAASDTLRQAIEERTHWPCSVPEYRQLVQV